MLTITIELVPAGFEPLRRTIATMRISNETALGDVCDYAVVATEAANAPAGLAPAIAECAVTGHDRRQRVWALIRAACAELERAHWTEP